jgi:hypothetical protein
MMKKRTRKTADELMAELEADPEWVAARAREEAERQKVAAELARAEAPLVAALRGAGYPVESVWDLANTRERYPAAVPILIEHLQRPYPGEIRDGIARALAIPEAKFAHHLLVRLWREEPDEPRTAKQGLAVALAVTAFPEHLDEVIELVRDPSLGSTRLLLLWVLEKSNEPRAWAALMALGTDPDISPEVQHILKKRQRKQSGRRVPRTNE